MNRTEAWKSLPPLVELDFNGRSQLIRSCNATFTLFHINFIFLFIHMVLLKLFSKSRLQDLIHAIFKLVWTRRRSFGLDTSTLFPCLLSPIPIFQNILIFLNFFFPLFVFICRAWEKWRRRCYGLWGNLYFNWNFLFHLF